MQMSHSCFTHSCTDEHLGCCFFFLFYKDISDIGVIFQYDFMVPKLITSAAILLPKKVTSGVQGLRHAFSWDTIKAITLFLISKSLSTQSSISKKLLQLLSNCLSYVDIGTIFHINHLEKRENSG